MITVQISDNESIDKALKRFKKKLEKSGALKEYRTRRFFVKPSLERKVEISKARYKQHHISKDNQ